MTVMDILEHTGANEHIHISELSDRLPKLFFGAPNMVPPALHFREVKDISAGTYYDKFTIFITLKKG